MYSNARFSTLNRQPSLTDVSKINALPPLRDIIREHGLRAEKALGQNFLLDLNLTSKIARTVRNLKGAAVFEVGPGPGGLTRALLAEGAETVIAIEYDDRAVAALQSLVHASNGRLQVIKADALKRSIRDLADQKKITEPFIVCANLPYNIATPLLTGWLKDIYERPGMYRELVLMFQKEVAQRIVALPRTKAYGRLSVLSQWLCDTKIMFDVPASAFTPPPKITSSIVRLVPKATLPSSASFSVIEEITAAAFGQRRKMIRGSMKAYLPFIESCGLSPEVRAEELGVKDYESLAALVTKARL